MARNGGLTSVGSVGLIARMSEQWSANVVSQEPLALERYNIQGTMLLDVGINELLPLLAGPAFGNLKFLSITATRLTAESTPAFIEFLTH